MTRTAEDIVRSEIHYCVSSLVSTLAPHWGTLDLSRDPTGLADLFEQAGQLAAPIDDWEEAAIQAGWTRAPEGWWWREPTEEELAAEDGALFYFLGSGPFVRADDVSEIAVRDNIEPYAREVYEHWIVSDWLADRLEAHGEKVDRDFAGMTIWARTTTGQSISMDAVIQAIYADLAAA